MYKVVYQIYLSDSDNAVSSESDIKVLSESDIEVPSDSAGR